jgi:DNA-binding NtrC family response regulator
MRDKILIIEKDKKIVEALSILIDLLQFEAVSFHNWNYKIKTLSRDDIAVIFLNIDNLTIKPEDILKTLNQQPGRKDKKIPLIYLCRSALSQSYKTFSVLPHAGELIKPFTLEDFFTVLRSNVRVGPIKGDINVMEDELTSLHDFNRSFGDWLEQIELLIEQNERVSGR